MAVVLIVGGAVVLYVIAYHTYGRWLARKIFGLDPQAAVPSVEQADGVDFVPSRKEIVFGHHFTSIAGTMPIVGPAIAIIWGWVPALLWVVLGSIFIGALHDLGALVVSMRNRGVSIGDLTGSIICPRARLLFMAVVFFELLIVVAIFVLVIASIFALYPQSVIPVWLEIPIAIVLGVIIARARTGRMIAVASIGAVAIMYATVLWGAYSPLRLPSLFGFPPTFVWAVILFIYAYAASVLPVHRLLQPRDFINAHQLFIAMGLLFVGVLVARPAIVAPALTADAAARGAPQFFPFLFIMIACGAVSGFHSLVSSGTSSKQLSSEMDAHMVGYGSMLFEGFLSVLVIVAVGAGIGMSYQQKVVLSGANLTGIESERLRTDVVASASALAAPLAEGVQVPVLPEGELPANIRDTLGTMREFRLMHPEAPLAQAAVPEGGRSYTIELQGEAAWQWHYRKWGAASGLGPKLKAFVDGAANMMAAFGMPAVVGLAIMGVFVASFGGTTLDTAARLQRYVVSEFARTARLKPLQNRYIAAAFVIVTAAALALWDGKGAGAMVLYPLFGALNQALASLALLVVGVYLHRRHKPTWMVTIPFVFMLVVTAWAMIVNIGLYHTGRQWHLFIIATIVLVLQLWLTVEAVIIWLRIRKERSAAATPRPFADA